MERKRKTERNYYRITSPFLCLSSFPFPQLYPPLPHSYPHLLPHTPLPLLIFFPLPFLPHLPHLLRPPKDSQQIPSCELSHVFLGPARVLEHLGEKERVLAHVLQAHGSPEGIRKRGFQRISFILRGCVSNEGVRFIRKPNCTSHREINMEIRKLKANEELANCIHQEQTVKLTDRSRIK